MRRAFAVVLVAAAVAVAGCGDGSEGRSSGGGATVAHAFGTTEVPPTHGGSSS